MTMHVGGARSKADSFSTIRGDLYAYAAEAVTCKQKNHIYKWLRIFVVSNCKSIYGERFSTLETFATKWSPFNERSR